MNSCTWYKSHVDNFSSSIINTLVYFVYSAVLRFTLFQLFDRKLPKQWLCNLFLMRRRFRAAISDATCSCALELPNLFFSSLPPLPCRYLALLILCRVTKGYNTSRLTLGKVASSSRHWHTDKNRERGEKKDISTFATVGNWKPPVNFSNHSAGVWEEVGAPRGRSGQTRGEHVKLTTKPVRESHSTQHHWPLAC